MTTRSALFLVCTLAGCARPPAGLVPLPYGATTPATADSVSSSLAHFVGLPPLDRTTLPAGTRELRLWHPPGMVEPKTMTRVVESPAGAMVQQVTYASNRRQPPSSEQFRQSLERALRREMGCRQFEEREGVRFCIGRPITGARARAIVATLDSLGAWNPPAPRGVEPNQRRRIDGAALWVEARVGSEYRAVLYEDEDFTAGGIAPRLSGFTNRIPIR